MKCEKGEFSNSAAGDLVMQWVNFNGLVKKAGQWREVQLVCIWRDASALQSRTQQCIRKCISGQLGGLQWTPNGSQCACASIQFINFSSSSSAFSFALPSSSEQ